LIYSSVFRTVNNKIKTNHIINLKMGAYHIQFSQKKEKLLLDSIKKNLVAMYFNEPIGFQQVFCDNLSMMVPIIFKGDGVYKVSFPRGKYNLFHYKNGKCVKIEAYSPLFDVTLIPAAL
jgi:hypothetical protein